MQVKTSRIEVEHEEKKESVLVMSRFSDNGKSFEELLLEIFKTNITQGGGLL